MSTKLTLSFQTLINVTAGLRPAFHRLQRGLLLPSDFDPDDDDCTSYNNYTESTFDVRDIMSSRTSVTKPKAVYRTTVTESEVEWQYVYQDPLTTVTFHPGSMRYTVTYPYNDGQVSPFHHSHIKCIQS
jgi:hypothetical protein